MQYARWITHVEYFYTDTMKVSADERHRYIGRGLARAPAHMRIRAPRAGTGACTSSRATRWWSTMAA
eukprot:7799715-Pyramimonas_sp.AAC.1